LASNKWHFNREYIVKNTKKIGIKYHFLTL
jgi:hypothetical protein